MLDSERNSNETDIDKATGHSAGPAPAPVTPAVPAALFQPPQVLFQPPAAVATPSAGDRTSGDREPEGESGRTSRRSRSRGRGGRGHDAAPDDLFGVEPADAAGAITEADGAESGAASAAEPETAIAGDGEESAGGRRRRRRTRSRSRAEAAAEDDSDSQPAEDDLESGDSGAEADGDGDGAAAESEAGSPGRRRRRKRRRGLADSDVLSPDDPPDTVVHVREPQSSADDVRAIKGSTRLEAKKQRRREGRESGRRRPPVITESEFLARRESVERTMVVRQRGDRTQIAVLEDGVLVEHYVNRTTHASYVGNVYLGKVQNVLPSMEAAFVDIGKGRNAVLYAGEVNFDASGLEGQPKRIESALKPGQSVIVQVTKDPVGHKGARLTSQVSLPGRYLVYVPGASMTGISRKLPDTERSRLKQILKKVTPENAGVIVRTAAEGAAEAELERDITRLAAQWENIEKKAKAVTAPALLYGEPDLTIRVVRDVFNEDFSQLIVSGDDGWEIIDEYVRYVAPHLTGRISRWEDQDAGDDVFAAYRIDEQLAKALERKVWLPSGGSLVIDRTEAMTVIDVNTGKFTGQGGNLEETVTRNNLEAAEEIVRQLRLRDVGGIVVIDFIDMVLESNRELVLRRLLECLARDRTKHQVAEVTSLGLVQMTRKRVGAGLLEAFSQPCECCNGRGVIVTLDTPAEPTHRASVGTLHRPVPAPPSRPPANGNGKGKDNGPGGGKAGYGNGRRSRRDDERGTADTDQGATALPAAAESVAEAGTVQANAVQADSAQADSAQAGSAAPDGGQVGAEQASTAQTDTTNGAPGDSGTGTDRATGANGRRTRRSTSAGTAFATAVVADDTAPLVPVVTSVPPVAETTPQGAASEVTGGQTTEPTEPPARRTRSGSAVARVTVVTEPGQAPAPEPASATAEAPVGTAEPSAETATAEAETATAEAETATAEAETATAEAETATAKTAAAETAEQPAGPAAATETAATGPAAAVGEAAPVDAEPPVNAPAFQTEESAFPAGEPLASVLADAAGPATSLEAPMTDAVEQAAEEPVPVSAEEPVPVSAEEPVPADTAEPTGQAAVQEAPAVQEEPAVMTPSTGSAAEAEAGAPREAPAGEFAPAAEGEVDTESADGEGEAADER